MNPSLAPQKRSSTYCHSINQLFAEVGVRGRPRMSMLVLGSEGDFAGIMPLPTLETV